MQTRRLADLAFLAQHYTLAFPLYQSLKKDFANDAAWLHYAGALEMAAITAFLLGPQQTSRPYPAHYMESALSCYASTCKRPLLAGRAALVSAVLLHSLGMASEVAAQVTSEAGQGVAGLEMGALAGNPDDECGVGLVERAVPGEGGAGLRGGGHGPQGRAPLCPRGPQILQGQAPLSRPPVLPPCLAQLD